MPDESLRERTERVKADPDTIEEIFQHLANGGSLIAWCEVKKIRYSDILWWMNIDPERKKKLEEGLDAQQQWAVHRLLQELRSISFIDIRKIFDDDHALKPVKEWPPEVAAAIAGIDVDELYDYEDGKRIKVGKTKKLKMFDKLKALEMLGKDLGRFVQKHEINGKLTLEDLVTGSKKDGQ